MGQLLKDTWSVQVMSRAAIFAFTPTRKTPSFVMICVQALTFGGTLAMSVLVLSQKNAAMNKLTKKWYVTPIMGAGFMVAMAVIINHRPMAVAALKP